MSSLFISHSSKDSELTRTVAAILRKHGYGSLFLDIDPEQGIHSGARWEQILYSKLTEARAVVVIHSEHWKQSRWCFAEVSHAKLLGRPVFPILIDASPLDPL
jgi:hypothetical protein